MYSKCIHYRYPSSLICLYSLFWVYILLLICISLMYFLFFLILLYYFCIFLKRLIHVHDLCTCCCDESMSQIVMNPMYLILSLYCLLICRYALTGLFFLFRCTCTMTIQELNSNQFIIYRQAISRLAQGSL